MNERIRELIDVCRGNPMSSAFEPCFDKEKFVKLIVKECMNVVSSKCASPTAYNALAEHFGIKE